MTNTNDEPNDEPEEHWYRDESMALCITELEGRGYNEVGIYSVDQYLGGQLNHLTTIGSDQCLDLLDRLSEADQDGLLGRDQPDE